MKTEELVKSLESRYAVKKFEKGARIAPGAWDALQRALVLSPSSYGLQPWKFFVVEDPALRAKLREASWGQSQVTDADKLVVFAARKGLGAADVDRLVARTASVRGVPASALEGYRGMLLGALNRPAERVQEWANRQVYIALGVFLSAAAALGVDACPMEGLDPAKYDELLGLEKKGYTALVAVAAGRRATDDGSAAAPKVRYAAPELIETV